MYLPAWFVTSQLVWSQSWFNIQFTQVWGGNLKPPVQKHWEWTLKWSRRHCVSCRKTSDMKYIYIFIDYLMFNEGKEGHVISRISTRHFLLLKNSTFFFKISTPLPFQREIFHFLLHCIYYTAITLHILDRKPIMSL